MSVYRIAEAMCAIVAEGGDLNVRRERPKVIAAFKVMTVPPKKRTPHATAE